MIYNGNKILYQTLQLQFEVSQQPNKVYTHFTDIFSRLMVLCEFLYICHESSTAHDAQLSRMLF